MPIEFPCDGCQQKLRVPDNSAGKQAKCPNCARILTIPASQAASPAAAPAPMPPADDDPFNFGGGSAQPVSGGHGFSPSASANPYASPTAAARPMAGGSSGAMSVQPMDPAGAVTIAWELFKMNAALLIGAFLTQFFLNMGISVVSAILQVALVQALGDPNSPAIALTNVGTSVLNQLLQLWIGIGILRINLAVARGQEANFGMLFSGSPYILRYIGASILFGLGMFVGILLLIVPGIYFALTYWSYFYFLVDRDCGVMESFRLAGEHAKGNRGNAFLMGLISMGLSMLGALLCGVGLLVAVPVVSMMMTICYLMMTGQRFWQPRAAGM
ncbi:hypothetical protein Poly24_35660 [Rosistilla carotiformis]|uniref:Zinc finger/thioredoxin putative domain-containing protein n=1 Tax=Rosistilla carotiformis TaxID=2528017 RepID=A0A518JWC9_9BACT|nr:hypothetical protein [Rosistilla carotiformis]QDV69848.1 hypothetical protein Poly24_35660 [Rosistilla carotiformis]